MSAKKFCLQFSIIFFTTAVSFAQQPKLMLPIGHTTPLFLAVFSPDGNRVLTTSHDKTAKIWDANTGSLLADLKGHTDFVYTGAFSSDGKKIVTGSHDNTAKIWDAAKGILLTTLAGHTNEIWDVHFSKDNKKIITSSKDFTAKVWDVLSGKQIVNLIGHDSAIQTICFSPDESKLLTSSYDGTARIWNAASGEVIKILRGHLGTVYSAAYSHDGRRIVTASADKRSIIWDAVSGKEILEMRGDTAMWMSTFSADDNKILTASFDGSVKLWDANTGAIIYNFSGHKASVWDAKFSPDNKTIASASEDKTVKIWNVADGSLIKTIDAHDAQVRTVFFNQDGTKLVTASDDRTAKIWNAESGLMLQNLKGYTSGLWSVNLSPDKSKILAAAGDNTAKIWDINAGGLVRQFKGHSDSVIAAIYSPDGKKIITISKDKTAILWDAENGNILAQMTRHTGKLTAVQFSPDGKIIATGSVDSTVKFWNANNGSFINECRGNSISIRSLQFSHDGKKIVTTCIDDSLGRIWDVATGLLLTELQGHKKKLLSAVFSPDDSQVVTAGRDSFAIVWNAITGKQMETLSGHNDRIMSAKFSPDGKKIVTASNDKIVKIWDAQTGHLVKNLIGHLFGVRSATFTEDGSKVMTVSRDNSAKIWDVASGKILKDFNDQAGEVESIDFDDENSETITSAANATVSIWDSKKATLLYTFFTVGKGSDYLVVDKDGHYDGTEAARKLLYFTCGTDIILLDQVKNKLWSPDLAARIMHKDSITDARLADLDICTAIPKVEKMDKGVNDFRFMITPGTGGLGQTNLYLNGILLKSYIPSQLTKEGGQYILSINEKDIKDKYISDADNQLQVKAFTGNSDISSRGIIISAKAQKRDTSMPNFYAVMIGVSKYKGEDLQLSFPAKDADDLAAAIKLSAGKMLDTAHVHVYNLTTNAVQYRYPYKKLIKQTIDDISLRSKPNDILLIFFAGHGILMADKKETNKNSFYFLTADASVATSTSTIGDDGISTDELTKWIDLEHMKAQKRILIFDACNSGAAINDMQNQAGVMNKRNFDKGQQVRAIDRLNERSGLVVLAASASGQAAYEMTKFGHGLLTYALLRAIKINPAVKEGQLLNVSRWFNAGEDDVSDLSKANGVPQHPQHISNTNFNIGVIDEQVIAAIKLGKESPSFARSNFHNKDQSVDDPDNLDLSNLVDEQLNEIASRGSDAVINYSTRLNDSPEALSLRGNYEVKGDSLLVDVGIKSKQDIIFRFTVTGKKSNLEILAAEIVKKATVWILKNKKD